jgi:KaiC/GvpD/RAD55 family RecA-like ATPase
MGSMWEARVLTPSPSVTASAVTRQATSIDDHAWHPPLLDFQRIRLSRIATAPAVVAAGPAGRHGGRWIMPRRSTGIEGLDLRIGGGIDSGSRNILYGPPGTGKTVFAMQFLWQGLQEGETVAFDVMDKPFPRLRSYFQSFGWDIGPFEEKGQFIGIQAFPHFEPYERDSQVRYFSLTDFEEMKRLDAMITESGVTRFAAGDFCEHVFSLMEPGYLDQVEDWTINWCHHDDIVNIDIMTEATERDMAVQRAVDLDLNKAHNIFRFRLNEEACRRELRIMKMEGCDHPLDWMPFDITAKGILLRPGRR